MFNVSSNLLSFRLCVNVSPSKSLSVYVYLFFPLSIPVSKPGSEMEGSIFGLLWSIMASICEYGCTRRTQEMRPNNNGCLQPWPDPIRCRNGKQGTGGCSSVFWCFSTFLLVKVWSIIVKRAAFNWWCQSLLELKTKTKIVSFYYLKVVQLLNDVVIWYKDLEG